MPSHTSRATHMKSRHVTSRHVRCVCRTHACNVFSACLATKGVQRGSIRRLAPPLKLCCRFRRMATLPRYHMLCTFSSVPPACFVSCRAKPACGAPQVRPCVMVHSLLSQEASRSVPLVAFFLLLRLNVIHLHAEVVVTWHDRMSKS